MKKEESEKFWWIKYGGQILILGYITIGILSIGVIFYSNQLQECQKENDILKSYLSSGREEIVPDIPKQEGNIDIVEEDFKKKIGFYDRLDQYCKDLNFDYSGWISKSCFCCNKKLEINTVCDEKGICETIVLNPVKSRGFCAHPEYGSNEDSNNIIIDEIFGSC